MKILERLKSVFACSGNTIKMKCKMSCLSKCCRKTEIEIDVDGDGKTDIELTKKESEVELKVIHN
jgi:hypothetical protein